ncbi:MAG: efflux RND transporter periplasmic adaptor subunit [Gammaproteobacteria bacterium]|jgi:multidrug efflux system membrane fusion protein
MPATPSSRRNSILIATAIALGLAVWIVSGLGNGLPAGGESAADSRSEAVSVAFRYSTARTMQRMITASARTEPDRVVELKAETPGRIVAIIAERGAFVAEGQSVLELDMRDRQARLAQATALIRQRELEYAAAERLRAEQFMSAAELAAAAALLESARAEREQIELDIARTRVVAPFDAVVLDRVVEIGDYVAIGDPLAQLVDSDPLIVVGNVNEKDIGALRIGSPGTARVLAGHEIEGTIRYLAPVADESTRSFRIELAIPNPDRTLRVGTSAELVLGAEEITAHIVSPGLLTLADDGAIGVMIVDDKERARFVAVELVGSTDEGAAIVTGPPQAARIISVGQNYVTDGQPVAAAEDTGGPI